MRSPRGRAGRGAGLGGEASRALEATRQAATKAGRGRQPGRQRVRQAETGSQAGSEGSRQSKAARQTAKGAAMESSMVHHTYPITCGRACDFYCKPTC